jgi:hypothetical protein
MKREEIAYILAGTALLLLFTAVTMAVQAAGV